MPSGGKALVFNTLERAVSTDMNRAQAFAARDRAELFRWLLNVSQALGDLQVGQDTQVTTLTSPLSGDVLGGLMVRPQFGSLNILVDPGVVGVVAPDSDTDASVYKLVNDPGVQTVGALAMTANASGSTRIDVIECQYTLNANAETDNRDIFNPATGGFAATTVSKATQGNFVYRVRAGTPGSGFPGTASGWLPLAVASVPTGTTNVNTVQFWDVRPLVWDRPVPLTNVTKLYPTVVMADYRCKNITAVQTFIGLVEADGVVDIVNGTTMATRAGGVFAGLNILSSSVLSGAVTNGVMFLYLAFPFGLPRWVPYTTTAPMVPTGPRGIPVFSAIAPSGPLSMGPQSAVNLPTGLGFTGQSTSAAIAVASFPVVGGTVLNFITDGHGFGYMDSAVGYSPAVGAQSGTNNSIATWTMTPNGNGVANLGYPANAREVDIGITIGVSVPAGQNATPNKQFQIVFGSGRDGQILGGAVVGSVVGDTIANTSGSPITVNQAWRIRVPVPADASLSTWNINLVTGLTNNTIGTLTGATATVLGWRI